MIFDSIDIFLQNYANFKLSNDEENKINRAFVTRNAYFSEYVEFLHYPIEKFFPL